MSETGKRAILDWDRLERVVTVYRVGEEPPEIWHWRDIRTVDRIEAVERLRRSHHGWERGNEPRLERVARIIEFA